MLTSRAFSSAAFASVCVLSSGCYQYSGDKGEPLRLWLYVAVGGAIVTALGLRTALSTPKDDSDRRGIGIGLAVGGAVLAILGIG